jgi:sporulation protein YunB
LFRQPLLHPVVWVLLALIVFCGVVFIVFERKFFPTILAFVEAKVVQTATKTVNDAVRKYILSQRLTYEDLVAVHKDEKGQVVLVQADTVRLNQMAAEVAVAVEKALADLEQQRFDVPLGQLLGSQFLATYGPKMRVELVPVGAVKVDMRERFESAGINQTRHRIFLHLDTTVRIAVPLHQKETNVATEIPLVENIIVGAVPSTFVSIPGVLDFLAPK